MKKGLLFGLISILCFTACDNKNNNLDSSKMLREPNQTHTLTKEEKEDNGFKNYLDKYDTFSGKLSEYYLKEYNVGNNIAISPLSIYLALTMGVEISASQTREEILSALDLSYNQVKEYTSDLINYCSFEKYSSAFIDTVLQSTLKLTNSIWIDNDNVSCKEKTLDSLANDYYCYSFNADFSDNNKQANADIKNFIKKESHDLINWNHDFDVTTLFAIINTLYLKDVWNDASNDLEVIKNQKFIDYKNKEVISDFLQGTYLNGKKYCDEKFTHFYIKTSSGFKLKFFVPNKGVSVDEVFNQENIKKINAIKDYNHYDEETRTRYFTRCIFPGFEASVNQDIIELLKEYYNINLLFSDMADLTNLLDTKSAMIDAFIHTTKLVVDKKGIEGSAVTVMAGNESAGPTDDIFVYEDFIVDRNFGYILTDINDNIVFSGVVNTLKK